MSQLKYLTRAGIHPQGLSKVYFCCHPKDHAACFTPISNQLLQLQNCSIWYLPPDQSVTDEAEHLASLEQMSLFVVPVTRAFLTTPNWAREKEFQFAIDHHIPILPLMQEQGLVSLFNRICGDLQFLDPYGKDPSALLFTEKLKAFLQSVLTDNALAQKVREAFDAYIFLSYRKKDRYFAQQLMQKIHADSAYRNVAVWYDEFLVPGEDFNNNIRTSLEHSALVVLAVTPNLLEEGNYVMLQEYPEAVGMGKPVVPVEMQSTDRQLLANKYPNIPNCVTAEDAAQLKLHLDRALQGLALRTKNTPMQDYYMGLAYLDGLDVERNPQYALQLLTSAAQAGITAAAEEVAGMYASGRGVARNTQQSVYWMQQLISLRLRDYQQDPTPDTCMRLLEDMRSMADVLIHIADTSSAGALYAQVAQLAGNLCAASPSDKAYQILESACGCLGNLYLSAGQYDEALEYYRKAEQWLQKALNSLHITVTPQALHTSAAPSPIAVVLMADLCVNVCSLGDVQKHLGEARQSIALMEKAQDCYDRVLRYLESDVLKDRYPGYRQHLAIVLTRQGDMEYLRAHTESSKRFYKRALEINRERVQQARENADSEAYEDFAISCLDLAMADPDAPDIGLLEQSLDIWKQMAQLLPEFTEYAQRAKTVEELLQKHRPAAPAPKPKPDPDAPMKQDLERMDRRFQEVMADPQKPDLDKLKLLLKDYRALSNQYGAKAAITNRIRELERLIEKFRPKTEAEILQEKADRGDPEAKLKLARDYILHPYDASRQDLEKALSLAMSVASGDSDQRQSGYGLVVRCYLYLKAPEKAAQWARKSAKLPCTNGVSEMLSYYKNRRTKNFWKALYWRIYKSITRSRCARARNVRRKNRGR